MSRLTVLLLPVLLLVACGHSPDRDDGAAPAKTAAPEAVSAPGPGAYDPRPAALPFRLDVTVSSDVSRALDAAGAQLTVEADYFGNARRGEALVDLGREERLISVRNQSITLAGRFDAGQVAREVSGDPRVKVSAGVARSAGPAVYCTEFEEALPIAVETGGFIHCELLSE
ncbi:putative lipoprotein [Hyphomonas polymorpha PS728]|uniref:Putative lipoprotein n=1 Tax=Hyphomonas polymorpha PS728 TaxID=1280954 RepID=A0A062VCC8_9PROT|nr:hypothetical protein [Hyphomonas polymorpha]KDA00132.1 putative lipoprotein [Hyphomonas polymorpha PS728]